MRILSRPLATGICRFLLVTLLSFVLLISTSLVISLLIAWQRGGEWISPQYLSIGFVCGMIVWLFVIVFHLRQETQFMPFAERDQFLMQAEAVLREMGYTLTSRQADTLTFRPFFHAYLFGGGIQVVVENQQAQVSGPKVSLELFRRSWRLLNYMQSVQQHLQDQRNHSVRVYRRIEIQLGLHPEQLEAVRTHLIEVLQKEANVGCELTLFVQSDQGIRENLLELQLRDWLEQQGISYVIRKGTVPLDETVPTPLISETAAP